MGRKPQSLISISNYFSLALLVLTLVELWHLQTRTRTRTPQYRNEKSGDKCQCRMIPVLELRIELRVLVRV